MVAKTIGTKVSFAWETVSGVRPTTGYKVWCDCTGHPDLNPEREQIETTKLCETNNKTYEDGLMDFGTLSFGSNLTTDTMDLFIGANGYVTIYATKQASELGLWACVDIQGINKSYFIPVKPQEFGLPSGEAGSNKYELEVRFLATGSAGWNDDPVYDTDTTYDMTITGYVVTGVDLDILKDDKLARSITTSDTSTIVPLPNGTYTVIARKTGKTSQIQDVTIDSDAETVTFTTMA
ncbi:MAG: hypothetical protein EOL95_09475 [Bacteroidia bacterium]|nr:hypothetical protein [Bacteroidia bacterium]